MANNLDFNYISDLVVAAREEDSNAFAELFAATCDLQYAFACRYLKDESLAREALQETYVYALKNLGKLANPSLFISWLNQITLRMCFRKEIQQAVEKARTAGEPYDEKALDPENRAITLRGERFFVRQIMTLTFTEAQVLLLKHLCGLRNGEISKLLVISKSDVRRAAENAVERLHAIPSAGEVSAR